MSLELSKSVSDSFVNVAVVAVAVMHKKPSRIPSSIQTRPSTEDSNESTTFTKRKQKSTATRDICATHQTSRSKILQSPTCSKAKADMALSASTAMPILYRQFQRNMAFFLPDDNYYLPIRHLVEHVREDREIRDDETNNEPHTNPASEADSASMASSVHVDNPLDSQNVTRETQGGTSNSNDNSTPSPHCSCGSTTTSDDSDIESHTTEMTIPDAWMEDDFSDLGSPIRRIFEEDDFPDYGSAIRDLFEEDPFLGFGLPVHGPLEDDIVHVLDFAMDVLAGLGGIFDGDDDVIFMLTIDNELLQIEPPIEPAEQGLHTLVNRFVGFLRRQAQRAQGSMANTVRRVLQCGEAAVRFSQRSFGDGPQEGFAHVAIVTICVVALFQKVVDWWTEI